mmetsp:Transcript_364/g.677  ORF Transcript_364/g.677 Transcript_364/m.677 type:complete len:103 (+) Transcript_364:1390-1698(+)
MLNGKCYSEWDGAAACTKAAHCARGAPQRVISGVKLYPGSLVQGFASRHRVPNSIVTRARYNLGANMASVAGSEHAFGSMWRLTNCCTIFAKPKTRISFDGA